jgi:hypothetical protein
MNCDPAREIVDGLLKLGALNVQIGVLMAETVLAAGHTIKALPVSVVPDPTPSDTQIEAIAHVLEQELLGKYELGFRAMLRLNFPRDRLREIVVTVLNAARDVAAAGQLTHLPGNDAR